MKQWRKCQQPGFMTKKPSHGRSDPEGRSSPARHFAEKKKGKVDKLLVFLKYVYTCVVFIISIGLEMSGL